MINFEKSSEILESYCFFKSLKNVWFAGRYKEIRECARPAISKLENYGIIINIIIKLLLLVITNL